MRYSDKDGRGAGGMAAAGSILQPGRWFDNSGLVPPRHGGNEYDGRRQERQRCKLTEHTVVGMDGA